VVLKKKGYEEEYGFLEQHEVEDKEMQLRTTKTG